MSSRKRTSLPSPNQKTPRAPAHLPLANELVHVFVDDQNLFWGIVNGERGRGFRIDFGNLLLSSARSSAKSPRGVASAYIAGVIPDDDSFWKAAENQGFKVFRGFLGNNNRSKQDDAFLIAQMVETIYTNAGPSTMVLVAGDADYGPALKKVIDKGWRVEIAVEYNQGVSAALEAYTHEFRVLNASEFARS